MPSNFSKLWLQRSLSDGATNRAIETIAALGKALPCSVIEVTGSIVTVKFEMNAAPWSLQNVTMPKAESNWIRMPTQVGDFGFTVPADVYLGGISGLGGGIADWRPVAPFGALVFVPVSNANSGPINPNAAQIQGPDGVILRTTTGTNSEVVTDTNGTTITYGSNSITINSSEISMSLGGVTATLTASGFAVSSNLSVGANISGGVGSGGGTAAFNGAVTTTGNVTAGAIDLQNHVHTGVTPGIGNSGGPTG